MRNLPRTTRLIAPALLLVLAGCFKLSRESPPLRLYVLSGTAAGAAPTSSAMATAPGAGGLTVGLRRMELASYLSEPAIVVRRGTNELITTEFHRWGEDLDAGINRVVGAYLASSSPVRAVEVAPWQTRAKHDFIVQLHVTRFEGTADSAATQGNVHVQAGWDIVRPFDGRVLIRGSSDDRSGSFRVGDYGALVTGLDAALQRVARDISACLARFPNDSTPPANCSTAAGVGTTR
ncbi:MAG TPA: PqiC family protein [Gemmatimonas sp.]|nr:PqiC family protein [Gemmatimonas sp.]